MKQIFLSLGINLIITMAANAATITVASTLDSVTGSLRQALADEVNGDRITFNHKYLEDNL